MSKLGPISHFISPVSCDSLVLQGLRCEWGAGVLNLVLSLSLSHTDHWKFNMAPHGKELSEDLKKIIVALHNDGVGYKKIRRPWNWAVVNQRNWVHVLFVISRGCVWEIDVLPALLQRLKGWRVSLSVLRPYTAHCIKLVCMAVIPEGSLF